MRGFSLVEVMVALAILAIVLVVGIGSFDLGKKDRESWERQIDDAYALIHGMERIRREIEVGRLVVFPLPDSATAAQREYLVLVDPVGRVVVYGVVDGDLVAQTIGEASTTYPKRVIIPRVDRILFHNREDVLAVRFQVFMGGMSLVSTVRAANALDRGSLDFAQTYGI